MTPKFDHLKPKRFIARELIHQMGRGRSEPFLIDCVDENGEWAHVVVKLRNPSASREHPWDLCLARDLAGSILARALGLHVPDYGIAIIDSDFLRINAKHPAADRLRQSAGVNFGSAFISSAHEDNLKMHAGWPNIVAMDALAYNADRKASNPNVLWDGRNLFAIDFGMMAPTWTFHIDKTNGFSLYGDSNIRLHVAYNILNGRKSQFGLTEHWGVVVSSELLEWLRTVIPEDWACESQIDDLIRFLSARYMIAEKQLNELQGVIN